MAIPFWGNPRTTNSDVHQAGFSPTAIFDLKSRNNCAKSGLGPKFLALGSDTLRFCRPRPPPTQKLEVVTFGGSKRGMEETLQAMESRTNLPLQNVAMDEFLSVHHFAKTGAFKKSRTMLRSPAGRCAAAPDHFGASVFWAGCGKTCVFLMGLLVENHQKQRHQKVLKGHQ